MRDIHIRITGRTGRITLNRPDALNALTYEMCLAIEDALDLWAGDDTIAMVIIDAAGDKAFSAGGDIVDMYRTASEGDFDYGRRFWADEYRLNAKIFDFPKPYVAFMQGFTMGGGVGVSCHGSHRIVGDTSRIAMPEVGIGLVPDVGGSLILSRAPGRLGEYLGTTAYRMGPGDAILAGFADYYLPEVQWPALIANLEETADYTLIDAAALPAPEAPLIAMRPDIDHHFGGETIADILRSMQHDPSAFTEDAAKRLSKGSPLAIGAAIEVIHRVRGTDLIARALDQEYRFTYRAAEDGDFIEGIRAMVIDKDKAPKWRHPTLADLKPMDVTRMLLPLGPNALKLERT
jgi:enoyl-CoA hydratase